VVEKGAVRRGCRIRVELFHVEVKTDVRGAVENVRETDRATGARRERITVLAENIVETVVAWIRIERDTRWME